MEIGFQKTSGSRFPIKQIFVGEEILGATEKPTKERLAGTLNSVSGQSSSARPSLQLKILVKQIEEMKLGNQREITQLSSVLQKLNRNLSEPCPSCREESNGFAGRANWL